MKPLLRLVTILALASAIGIWGCAHKQSTTQTAYSSAKTSDAAATANPAVAATSTPTAAPDYAEAKKTPVIFEFSDIAVTTSGPTLLRLGFTLRNGTKDALLCDPSEFSVVLSTGDIVNADTSAENICQPDTVDPNVIGKATMFFDLKSAYSGPVTLVMTIDNKVVGRGTAMVH